MVSYPYNFIGLALFGFYIGFNSESLFNGLVSAVIPGTLGYIIFLTIMNGLQLPFSIYDLNGTLMILIGYFINSLLVMGITGAIGGQLEMGID